MHRPIVLSAFAALLLTASMMLSGCVDMAQIQATVMAEIGKLMGKEPPSAEHAEGEETEEEELIAAEPPEPFSYDDSSLMPEAMRDLPYEELEVETPDKVALYARLYDPSQLLEEPDPGQKYPLVVLIHGLNHSHRIWQDLPARLVDAGYAVVALDLRGHGQSTLKAGRKFSWRLFKEEDWKKMPQDVLAIIQTVSQIEDYPQVDASRMGLIGESLGANVLSFVAQKKPNSVKAVVMLSPGLEYKHLVASQAIVDYGNAAFLVASNRDEYSFNSTQRLYKWFTGPKLLQLYKVNGIGSDMLTYEPELKEKLLVWMSRYLPPSGTVATEETAETAETATH